MQGQGEMRYNRTEADPRIDWAVARRRRKERQVQLLHTGGLGVVVSIYACSGARRRRQSRKKGVDVLSPRIGVGGFYGRTSSLYDSDKGLEILEIQRVSEMTGAFGLTGVDSDKFPANGMPGAAGRRSWYMAGSMMHRMNVNRFVGESRTLTSIFPLMGRSNRVLGVHYRFGSALNASLCGWF
jgi:hypothetical protein